MSFQISPSARDITFNFYDSCNCCCCISKPPLDMIKSQIYVNKFGEVVPFDVARSKDVNLDMQKTAFRLECLIKSMSEDRKKDHEELIKKVDGSICPLRSPTPVFVTLGMVQRMVELVDEKS